MGQPVFERSDRIVAITAELSSLAVVEQHDVSAQTLPASNKRESSDQVLERLRFPVAGGYRPHYDPAHTSPVNFGLEHWAAPAAGWAQPSRRFVARGCGNRVLAAKQLLTNSGTRLEHHIEMGLGVIAKQMSSREGFTHEVRTGTHKSAKKKKSRANRIAVEQVEQARRHCGVWTVVECEPENFALAV